MAALNRTELAKKLGISLTSLDNWTRRGCPGRKVGGRWRFNLDEVRLWRNSESEKNNSINPEHQAKIMNEYYRAQLLLIEFKARKAKLINKKQLHRGLNKFFTFLKKRIRAVAPECARKVAELDIQGKKQFEVLAEVQEILKTEHDQALQELSEWKVPAAGHRRENMRQ